LSVFKQMHEKSGFDSQWEFEQLLRMLSEAISRGYVEQVPVMKPSRFLPLQKWFRDKETGEIYSLVPPDGDRGWWAKIDPQDIVGPDENIQ